MIFEHCRAENEKTLFNVDYEGPRHHPTPDPHVENERTLFYVAYKGPLNPSYT
jgi:hypothetical protein